VRDKTAALPRCVITGASGFIGSKLYSALATDTSSEVVGIDIRELAEAPRPVAIADIRERSALREFLTPDVKLVYHLAALAEVVMPFSDLSALFATNVNGTFEVLDALPGGRAIFASSSAVYGTTSNSVSPEWENVRPIGPYGISKASAELIGQEWVTGRPGVFLAFRFGNVIGPGCRGLIPYLVQHAIENRGTRFPAQLRGGGRILRDYVPIQHVLDVMQAAAKSEFRAGTAAAYNIGTARALTNREVAERVREMMQSRGIPLEINYENPVALGESLSVTLDIRRTVDDFGIVPPSEADVIRAIDEATLSYLDAAHLASRVASPGRQS
jgi:UDP-glucose 4-epimerase